MISINELEKKAAEIYESFQLTTTPSSTAIDSSVQKIGALNLGDDLAVRNILTLSAM